MRRRTRAASRIAELERRQPERNPWPLILGDVSDEKLRRLDLRKRGDAKHQGDSQRTFAEVLVDGESDETVVRWWELLSGKRTDGVAARAALLRNVT